MGQKITMATCFGIIIPMQKGKTDADVHPVLRSPRLLPSDRIVADCAKLKQRLHELAAVLAERCRRTLHSGTRLLKQEGRISFDNSTVAYNAPWGLEVEELSDGRHVKLARLEVFPGDL